MTAAVLTALLKTATYAKSAAPFRIALQFAETASWLPGSSATKGRTTANHPILARTAASSSLATPAPMSRSRAARPAATAYSPAANNATTAV